MIEVPGPEPLTRPVTVSRTRYEQRDITIDGNRLRYIDLPARHERAGARPLVIIPGHTARIEGFDPMVPALTEHHRLLILDFPGSGYSDKPVREYTVRLYEDTQLAFLDALGIDQAVLLGGSLGGNLTLRLGHRDPRRFPRLVAWGPAGAWKAQPLVADVLRRFKSKALFWPTVWGQSRYWYSPDFPGRGAALDETFAYYREVMSEGFLRMYFGMAADQLGGSLFDLADTIPQPTLLVLGEHDDGAGMQAGVARLHELIPHNRLEVFAGVRHSVETERPDELAASILAFLAEPDPTPSPTDAAAQAT